MAIDSYLAGFFLITASTAASIVGLLVVRRVLHSRNLISSHDVGGYLLSVVGTLYAVILGLIVVDEWPMLDHGRFAPTARRAAFNLVDAVKSFEPRTGKEQEIYAAEVSAVCEFWNDRRTRINTAAHGVPPLEWAVLILGGVITVSFTYFFKLEHLNIQIIMTAMVAVIIALCLFLVLMFGYPFSGELKVDPSNFKVAHAILVHQAGRPSRSPGGR